MNDLEAAESMGVLVMLQFKPKTTVLGRQRDAPSLKTIPELTNICEGKKHRGLILRGLDKHEPKWRHERLGKEWTYVQEWAPG